jgi:hypothetical protein
MKMEKKLTKRQLKSLIRKVAAEFQQRAAGKNLSSVTASSLNGCVVYRGPGTQPYCENLSGEACHELDLRVRAENPNYYAVPLNKPCERTS